MTCKEEEVWMKGGGRIMGVSYIYSIYSYVDTNLTLCSPFIAGICSWTHGVYCSSSTQDHMMIKSCPRNTHTPSTHTGAQFTCIKSYTSMI